MEKSVAASPGTSVEPGTTHGREPRLLSPEEFRERLFARAQTRYGIVLNEGWLVDLIKDGCIDGATRYGNAGMKPIYRYGYRSYRTALQIARFRHWGIVERNDIAIMMFIKGYGHIRDIRHPLAAQYAKYIRSFQAQVRSGYADNWKDIPMGHKQCLLDNMGPLDGLLAAGGYQLDDDAYIHGLRSAKQAPIDESAIDIGELSRILNGPLSFSIVAPLLMPMLNGMLMLGGDGQRNGSSIDDIGQLIHHARNDEYEQARQFVRGFPAWLSALLDLIPTNGAIAERRNAAAKVAMAIRTDPRWATSILVLGLIMARLLPIRFRADDIGPLSRQIRMQSVSLPTLLNMLNQPKADDPL